MNRTTRFFLTTWSVAGLAGFVYGCSAGGDGKTSDPLPENTGAIVARLTNVPADVQCVQIQTSDWRTPMAQADVTPGGSAEIRIAPLNPGNIWLSGTAYSVPCWQLGYGSGSSSGVVIGPMSDAGGGGSTATWSADSTYVFVAAGQTTKTDLHFHHLGALDVTVDFDNCDADASFSTGCPGDGGLGEHDAEPPPVFDAGPIILSDAGAPKGV